LRNDVLLGNVHMMNEPVSLPHAKIGKLSLLDTNARAAPHFPQVPSLAELGIAGCRCRHRMKWRSTRCRIAKPTPS
jgi:tripartite-type tricarboxylate transporter receptor subunit TctC